MLLSTERLLSSCALRLGSAYPKDALDSLWRKLLLCQVHDSICGCHVDSVYYELMDSLKEMGERISGMAASAMARVEAGGGLRLFNPVPFAARRMISVDPDVVGKGMSVQLDNGKAHFIASLPALGFKLLKPAGKVARRCRIVNDPAKLRKFKHACSHFLLEVNDGELSIKAMALKRDIIGARFGEILFRNDDGTLWTERFASGYYGFEASKEVNACMQSLNAKEPQSGRQSSKESVTQFSTGPVFDKVVLEGEALPIDPGFGRNCYWHGFVRLTWKKEFIFPKGLPYFKLRLTVDFEGRNTKVYASFPLDMEPRDVKARYEVPYGYMERKPYFEVPCVLRSMMEDFDAGTLSLAKGDWPALNWVDCFDGQRGLTIANTGTPGHQVVDGRALVSLLRSPSGQESDFQPGPATWENRSHVYEFEFLPHEGDGIAEATALGLFANNPPFVEPEDAAGKGGLPETVLSISAPEIALSALKKANDGKGWMIRLYETCGRPCRASLDVKFKGAKIFNADMRGAPQGAAISTRKLAFSPFEIKTLYLQIPCGC